MPKKADAVQLDADNSRVYTIEDMLRSFERSLQAREVSKNTFLAYTATVAGLIAFLKDQGMSLNPLYITREHIEMYMIRLTTTPLARSGQPPRSKTLILKYQVLKLFFKWLVDMDEIQRSPMERMSAPRVTTTKRQVLTPEQVKAVLKTCEGRNFFDRRDYALVMLFIDTGIRLGEMAALQLADIDWSDQSVLIRRGKGGKARTVYFGKRTLRALDQYVNLKGGRRDHKYAELKRLWLSRRGEFADSGIAWMLKNRGKRAGLENLHPHLWRHYFIHASLKAGAQVGDLMRQTGHTKIDMLLHYGEAAADERARESHRRLGPGDNL